MSTYHLTYQGCATKDPAKEGLFLDEYSLEEKSDNPSSLFAYNTYGPVTKASLPLVIKVDRGPTALSTPPRKALGRSRAKVHLKRGKCQFSLYTGNIQIDQFIFTNRWIRYNMALKKNQLVRLERGRYGNFRATMDIKPYIHKKFLAKCKSVFEGKRVFIGKIHLNHSRLGLSGIRSSKKMLFHQREPAKPFKKLYLIWPRGRKAPQVQDEYQLQATHQTPIYRTKFRHRGSYYLIVNPKAKFIPSSKEYVLLSAKK